MLPYALLIAAVGLAWALDVRDRRHRPAALALTALLASDVVQLACDAPTRGPTPYAGGARAAFHAGQAAFLAYPAVTVALCLVVLARPRATPAPTFRESCGYRDNPRSQPVSPAARAPWPVLAAWAVAVAGVAVAYPALRGEPLGRVYGVVQALACAVCLWSLGHRRASTAGEWVAVALTFAVGWELAGAYLGGHPFASWDLPRIGYVIAYGVVILIQGSALWQHRRR